MKILYYTFFIIVLSLDLKGQVADEYISGKVSFVSSQNIYVKFESTSGISPGDTLYISSDGQFLPALKVNNLSSSSCVCTSISSLRLNLADQVSARIRKSPEKTDVKVVADKVKEDVSPEEPAISEKKQPGSDELKQKIRGSLSAYSYSDFSNTSSKSSNRFRYNLTLDARNISNSKFSVESYISFNHKSGDWEKVKSNLSNALKVYSLAIKYDLNKTTHFSLGRRINPRISSIGAMDGLQFEKSIGKFSVGTLIGTRPDYMDYGFNSKLFQYGAYLGFSTNTQSSYSESSIAIMQQTNSGSTDRRFLYFQHSNSFVKNLYFMSTFEVDLYKLKSDSLNNYTSQNTFDPTGFYLSLRYRVTKNLSITGSYDGRKNVMYYETYKSFIDRILESEMRQSFRLQGNYRITKNLMFGLQSGYRYLKSDPHPSRNANGYLTYSQIPGVNLSVTVSGTYLESNYLNSRIYGISLSKDFLQGKFYTELGYHYMDYRYPESQMNTIQNIGDLSLYWQFTRSMSFSVNYEGTFEKQNKYNRIFLQIRKRF